MAISVGSVEVDVVPNTQGIYRRLRDGLAGPAARAGAEAGEAAGRAFGPAMAGSVGDAAATRIGRRLGASIGRQIAVSVQGSLRDGVTEGGRAARSAATRQGEETAGAFARAARARLEAAYRAMPRLDVTLSTTGADADLARLRARMESLSSRRIGVDVDAATALREITDLETRLRQVGESHPNVAVRSDTAAAGAELAALRAQIQGIDGDDIDIDVKPAVRSVSTLTAAILTIGPAALPVLGAVTVGVGALAASFAAAGVAGGVFGAVIAQQVKGLKEQRAAVQQARDAVTQAEQQMAAADTKAQRAAAAKKLAEAQKQLAAAQREMSPASKTASKAMDGLSAAWSKFLGQTRSTSLGLATRGMNLLAKAIPRLKPLFEAAAGAADNLLSRLGRFVTGGGLDRLVAWIASTARPTFRAFVDILGNVAAGFGGMLRAFTPASRGMMSGLVSLSERFRQWGQSGNGVRRLLAYVRQTGPGVGEALRNIAGAALNLLSALSPLAGTGVSFLNALAAGVRAIPTSVLTALGVTFASIAIGSKLAAIGMALWRGAATAAAVATRILTGQTLALNAAQRANLIGIIVTAIMALVVAVIYAWRNFGWFRNAVMATWNGIKTAALWAWNVVLKPVFNGIMTAIRFVGQVAMWLWRNVFSPVFHGIGLVIGWWWTNVVQRYFGLVRGAFRLIATVAMWLWRNIFGPVFRGIASVVRFFWGVASAIFLTVVAFVRNVLAPAFRWLYRNVIKPVWNGISKAVRWAWENVIKPVWNSLRGFIRDTLGPVFRWLRDKVVKPVWAGIKAAVQASWEKGIRPAFNAVKSAVKAVSTAFSRAKDAIKRAWDKLKDIAKKPVNFIIGTVYMGGIKKVWDKVVGAFGGKPLPKVSKLATGGVLPGYTPGKDIHLAALSGGEAVMRPEWTRAVGPEYVHQMNAAARHGGVSAVQKALGIPGFSLGGVFKGIGNVASGAWDRVKKGAKWLKDTFGGAIRSGVKAVVNPLINLIPGDGTFPRLLRSGARKMVDLLIGAGKKGDAEAGAHISYKPGRGVKQWAPVVRHALREVHQPQALVNTTLRRMNQESGGNPRAVNKWDSNWKAGYPSVGLMQVIRPTFNRWAGKYRHKGPKLYGVSIDPLANIYSSMRYALGAYGSLSRAYNRKGGYDSGGLLQPGLNLAYNGTGRPEPVLTGRQWDMLAGAATATRERPVTVEVHTRDEALADFIDVRADTRAGVAVRRSNGQLLAALRARAGRGPGAA